MYFPSEYDQFRIVQAIVCSRQDSLNAYLYFNEVFSIFVPRSFEVRLSLSKSNVPGQVSFEDTSWIMLKERRLGWQK